MKYATALLIACVLPPGHPMHLDGQHTQIAIAVDEWQWPREDVAEGPPLHRDNPYGLIGSIQGMIDAKALNPELFIMVCWRGTSSIRSALEHEAVDLPIIEGAILKRGEGARAAGYIDRTIFMHGYLHGSDNLETFEGRIHQIRERFPEMPGMALYTAGGTPATHRNDNEEWLRGFDNLLRKYFVEPAPEVRFTAPRFEAWIDADRVKLDAEAEGPKVPYSGVTLYVGLRLDIKGVETLCCRLWGSEPVFCPGGRIVDSRLRRRAIDSTHRSSPRGLPRCADNQTAANSCSAAKSRHPDFQTISTRIPGRPIPTIP